MKMADLSILIRNCFTGCQDNTRIPHQGTRFWNLTDRPVELQIRVGSTLKKGSLLKPGSSKRLKCKSIYKTYMPNRNNNDAGKNSLLYYSDDRCQPYIWIHDSVGNSLRMVKQQYISLDDLRESSEIKIIRDHRSGCISVTKKQRSDFC